MPWLQTLGNVRPLERLRELDDHDLLRLGAVPRVRAADALNKRHLADVRADFGDLDVVEVPEVVPEVEFGEGERDAEAGFVGRQMFFSEEGNYVARTGGDQLCPVCSLFKQKTYMKICFFPR